MDDFPEVQFERLLRRVGEENLAWALDLPNRERQQEEIGGEWNAVMPALQERFVVLEGEESPGGP